eukprot:723769-Amphidinium_carterae.1
MVAQYPKASQTLNGNPAYFGNGERWGNAAVQALWAQFGVCSGNLGISCHNASLHSFHHTHLHGSSMHTKACSFVDVDC